MADRCVLLIDTDTGFQETLRRALAPYGVQVVAVDDGSDGMAKVREVSPELLLISVELPKKEGYGLFSRAKKGPAKQTPVALVTASVTPEDFAKHKKLSTHADEYFDKRDLDPAELVRRIDALINLGPAQVSEEDLQLDVEEAEEFSIDDDLAVVDDGGEAAEAGDGEEHTRLQPNIPKGLVDEGIDAETDAAFEALGMGGDEGGFDIEDAPATAVSAKADVGMMNSGAALAVPVVEAEPAPASPPRRSGRTAPPPIPKESFAPPPVDNSEAPTALHDAAPADATLDGDSPAEPPTAVAVQAVPAPAGDLDLGLDAVAEQAAAPAAAEGGARVRELQAEVERLRKELDAARLAPPGGAGSREREFKNLREMISRKERELDDLKEENEAKDAQILAGKEKLKELQGKLRETEERLLNAQEEAVSAKEQVSVLTSDKERGLEREKGLKARLDLSQNEVRKAHDEISELKARAEADHKAAAAALGAEQEAHAQSKQQAADTRAAMEAAHAQALADAEARRQRELAAQQAELDGQRAAAVASLEAEREEQLAAKEAEHQAAFAALREEHAGEIAALHAAHEDALAKKDRERQAALAKATEEREAALSAGEERRVADLRDAEEKRQKDLAAQAEEHARQLTALNNAHFAELQRREQDKQAALAAAETIRQEELAEAEKQRQADLAAAEKRRVDELAAAEDKHVGEIGAVTTSFEAERDELRAQHAQKVTELTDEINGLRAALAGARDEGARLDGELGQARETIVARDNTIEVLRGEVSDRDGKIAGLRQDVEGLEGENARLQEQVLRAYQKIKADEDLVGKAKKAMAIALTLLDEQKGIPAKD